MTEAVRIVVIDDNPGSLELMCPSALARSDVGVYTAASNPAAGLELVRKLRPQLVITDLVMPGLSGLEVLEQKVSQISRSCSSMFC